MKVCKPLLVSGLVLLTLAAVFIVVKIHKKDQEIPDSNEYLFIQDGMEKQKVLSEESWFSENDLDEYNTCEDCDGTGLVAGHKCKQCDGHGTLEKKG